MKKKIMVVQKVRCRVENCEIEGYEIVKVNVPTEFYFDDKGELTGFFIRIGNRKLTQYQRSLLHKVMRIVMPWEDEGHLPESKQPVKTKVPKVFKDAFKQ